MSGWKIKKLVSRFNATHEDMSYAEHKAWNSEGEEKEDWEDEADYLQQQLFDLEDQIKKLEPSKYMLENCPGLEDIINGNW